MISIKLIGKNDELLWKEYFTVSQEIHKRHYTEGYNPDLTFAEFKELMGADSESSSFKKQFLVVVDNNITGWFDCTEYEKTLYFMYDFNREDLNEPELKFILQKVLQFTGETKCTHAELLTYRKIMLDHFFSIHAPVAEKILISRLRREEMDVSFYKKIVAESTPVDLELRHFNEIPEEFINDFVKSVNECFEDRDKLSDIQNHYPPLTPGEWYKDKERLSEEGTKLEYLVLFDRNKIAGLCWVCVDQYRKDLIRHSGGFTAVNRAYRGRGLARYLKARMYIRLLDENKDFRYISTDTMPWNTYMYNINREFGFKPHKNGCAFKLTAGFLETYLNKCTG